MFYKLSNTAERELIEKEFGTPFQFPKLYQPQAFITGLEETTIPIITMDNPSSISYGIWGMLPEKYEEDWIDFQEVTNTLTIDNNSLNSNFWYTKSLPSRRCLILVTGYFTSFLQDGITYPYYVSLASKKPFCLAGIYNKLVDGFITCSIITTEANSTIKSIHNLSQYMPLIIENNIKKKWLNKKTDLDVIKKIIKSPENTGLTHHAVAKEFFKNNISSKSILNPIIYKNRLNTK